MWPSDIKREELCITKNNISDSQSRDNQSWSLLFALWERSEAKLQRVQAQCRKPLLSRHYGSKCVCLYTLPVMNASHKSSLNDSSLNDSHSSDCLLSGGRSWIKPLTGNQAGVTSRGQQAQAPKSSPRPNPPPTTILMESKQTDNFFQLAQTGQPNKF